MAKIVDLKSARKTARKKSRTDVIPVMLPSRVWEYCSAAAGLDGEDTGAWIAEQLVEMCRSIFEEAEGDTDRYRKELLEKIKQGEFVC